MGRFLKGVALLTASVLIPSLASAQGSIAGIVKDTSGAVLPGVTVEAASPALIEKVRSVVSDGAGQYQIVNLPPGAYTVNFTGYGQGLGYFDPDFPTTPIWGATQLIDFDYDIMIVPEPSMRCLLAFILGAGALAFRRQILSRALPAISAS